MSRRAGEYTLRPMRVAPVRRIFFSETHQEEKQ